MPFSNPAGISTKHCFFPLHCFPLLLNDHRHETLGVLDVDGLDVAVKLLLRILLVVSSSANSDA